MSNQSQFDALHHVCIVVRDLQKTMAYYESLGIGPWQDFPALSVFDLDVPDRDAFLDLQYKFAVIGNMQIQLCQPGAGNTPQKTFLDERGEGVFHLGFTVPEVDQATQALQSQGVQALMSGRLPADSRYGFTYFDTANAGAGVNLVARAAKAK